MIIAPTAQVRPRVIIGEGARIGDFVILGEWPEDDSAGRQELILGSAATIRSHTVIYAGVKVGDNFQTGHSTLIRNNCRIGDNVSIGSHSIIEHTVQIGNGVRIHSGVFIPELTILEDNCWIGPRVVFTNAPHPRCVNLPKCLAGVTVRRGAKIGANVTLLPGVVIGENALVGAGALVTKDVPAGMVVAGAPARVTGPIEKLRCPLDGTTPPYGG